MENHHAHGKTHYVYGQFQWQTVKLPKGMGNRLETTGTPMGPSWENDAIIHWNRGLFSDTTISLPIFDMPYRLGIEQCNI